MVHDGDAVDMSSPLLVMRNVQTVMPGGWISLISTCMCRQFVERAERLVINRCSDEHDGAGMHALLLRDNCRA